MSDAGPAPHTDSDRRRQARIRARRGVVASYIHEISERHEVARTEGDRLPEPAEEPDGG